MSKPVESEKKEVDGKPVATADTKAVDSKTADSKAAEPITIDNVRTAAGTAAGPTFRQRYFAWKPLPWWSILILTVYIFSHVRWRIHESPCTILGLSDPVTTSSIKKIYRTLSLCTHPDRLRTRLKRAPTEQEEQTGSILFGRFTDARDSLVKHLDDKEKRLQIRKEKAAKKRKKAGLPPLEEVENPEPVTAQCGELEEKIETWLLQLWKELSATDPSEIFYYIGTQFYELIKSIVLFEQGIMNSIMLGMWLLFLFNCVKKMLSFAGEIGFGAPFYLFSGIFIQPIPTVIRFFSLPFMRAYVYFSTISLKLESEELEPSKEGDKKSDDPKSSGEKDEKDGKESDEKDDKEDGKDDKSKKKSTLSMAAESEETKNKNLRKRRVEKKREDDHKKEVEKLIEKAEDDQEMNPDDPPQKERANMTALEILKQSSPTPNKARMQVAEATQFDLLLPLTKPVVPLMMLIFTGQVFSGIWSSIIISQILRSWIPKFNYETHHVFCFCFGFLHTLLGVSAGQVEQHAENNTGLLVLSWEWGFKDLVSIINMIIVGAFVASLSQMGNEPQFCNSFASGLSFRIFVSSGWVRELSITQAIIEWWTSSLLSLNIVVQDVEGQITNATSDIGGCGGGLFRSLAYGDENLAFFLSQFLKVFLIILPFVSGVIWLHRAYSGSRGLLFGSKAAMRKRKRLTRVSMRLWLGCMGLLQCVMLVTANLNAANGGLMNLWLAFLLGSVFESLLSLEDIRGHFRQFIVMIVFIFI